MRPDRSATVTGKRLTPIAYRCTRLRTSARDCARDRRFTYNRDGSWTEFSSSLVRRGPGLGRPGPPAAPMLGWPCRAALRRDREGTTKPDRQLIGAPCITITR